MSDINTGAAAPQDERERFEAWAKDRGYQRDELARCKLGIVSPEYFNMNTEYAWKAWQARAALPAQAFAPWVLIDAGDLGYINSASGQHIATAYLKDARAIVSSHNAAPVQDVAPSDAQPVRWEWRIQAVAGDESSWSEWAEVLPRNPFTDTVTDRVAEFQAYIERGYLYQLRALYVGAHPAAQPADALGISNEWMPFALTLNSALDRGEPAALLMDENSPLRGELRRLINAARTQEGAAS